VIQAGRVQLNGSGLPAAMDQFQQNDIVEFPLLYHIFFERPPSPEAQQKCFGSIIDIYDSKKIGESKVVVCRSTSISPIT